MANQPRVIVNQDGSRLGTLLRCTKYLDVIKAKTLNPVPPAQRAAQDVEGYV
ncbi:MAG: hypothetical protein AAGA75_08610 [Cyanobacteria bacterium P01_E01_bin.6]